MLIPLHIASGCCCIIVAELSTCDRERLSSSHCCSVQCSNWTVFHIPPVLPNLIYFFNNSVYLSCQNKRKVDFTCHTLIYSGAWIIVIDVDSKTLWLLHKETLVVLKAIANIGFNIWILGGTTNIQFIVAGYIRSLLELLSSAVVAQK